MSERVLITGGAGFVGSHLADALAARGHAVTLFDNLEPHVGGTFPVPIVNNAGEMVGWAYFHLVDIEGAPDKVIRGYFVSPVNADKLVVKQCGVDAQLDTGVMPSKLTN